MEQLKSFHELMLPDERHAVLDQITGTRLTLEGLYDAVSGIELNETVPEEIRSQFNVTRNLAIYTWFSYSLDPVVQLKTYILIEHALKLRLGHDNWRLPKLVRKAISRGLLRDSGFSHLNVLDEQETEYVRSMIDALPQLRNLAAHGSNSLSQYGVIHLQICADWINQLYRDGT